MLTNIKISRLKIEQESILYSDVLIAGINHGDLSIYFPRITVTRDGRIQTLLDAFQHGCVIRCCTPHCSMRTIMSYNETTALETSAILSRDIIVFVFITIVILLFIKWRKKKDDKINELHEEFCQRSGNYGNMAIVGVIE